MQILFLKTLRNAPLVRIAIRSVVLVGVFSLLSFFLAQRMNGLAERMAADERLLQSNLREREAVSRLSREEEHLPVYLTRLEGLLPASVEELIRFDADLKKIAGTTANTLTVAFSGLQGTEDAPQAQFSITVQGNRDSFRGFLEQFTLMPYFARLENLRIEGGEGLNAVSTLKAGGIILMR